MRKLTLPALITTLVLSPLVACVPKDKYVAAVADAQQAHAQLDASEKARQAEEADLRQQLADAQQKSQELDQKLSDLSTADHNLQARLDESTAIGAQLRTELEKLGKNVDSMFQEKGTLSKALDDAKGRLDELRKAQAAAEARAKLFKDFIQKLKSMIDAGQLRVATRAGRLVIQLPNDVLFDSGQKAIKPAGKQALTALAKVLVTVPGRSFQVAGDTDNLPIRTQRFASNWELSTARAVEVVHFRCPRRSTHMRSRPAGIANSVPWRAMTRLTGARRIDGSRSPCSRTSTNWSPRLVALPSASPLTTSAAESL